jgi:PHD/YefM family antitoxin component YafN of YafNO toxin-antitoxin module
VTIERGGQPPLVIVSLAELEALDDTLDLLGNHEAMAELRQSELDRERGATVPLDPSYWPGT